MIDDGKTKRELLDDLARLRQRVAQLEMLDTDRRVWEEALQYRVAFERLIASISTNFINLAPDEIDGGIDEALEKIGRFVDADRSYVFWLTESGRMARRTHEWCADGTDSALGALGDLTVEDFPWAAEKLLRGEVLHVPSLADLPPEAAALKALNEQDGAKSFVCVPMLFEKSVVGLVGFDCVRKETTWSEDSISLLKIVGQIFASALERKEVEQALRESEDKFRALVQELPDGVCIYEKGRIVFSNDAYWRMLRFGSAAEIVGADSFDFIAPQLREAVRGRVHQGLLESKAPIRFETMSRRRDGSEFASELVVTKMMLEGRAVIMVILRDISQRKRAERALRTAERERVAILNSMSEMVVYHDTNMRILWANRAAAESAGLRPHQLIARCCHQLWHDRETPCEGCPVLKALETGQTHEAEVTSEPDRLWFVRGYPVRDSEGQVVGVVEVVLDITDRKQAEEALAAEKERLAVTLRSIADGVITTDTEGRIVLINGVAEDLTAWSQEEAVGRPLGDVLRLVEEKTRRPQDNPVEQVLRTGGIVELSSGAVLLAKDGAERVIAHSGAPIRDGESRIIGVVLVFRDVTEKRMIEAELTKASKLESVGLLAGGIAHDFNNILTGIVGNLSLAKLEAAPGSRLLDRLTEAEKAAMRAKDLTQRLLTFSMGGAPVKKTTSVGDLLRDSASFVLTGSRTRCEFSIPDNLWPIEVDEGQISQVINNMVINADQAMPEGGVVSVSAQNVAVGDHHVLPLRPGRYIRIAVQDEGIGMPEEHLPRIFDPYFSTKQKGSGLGLATSYSIVKNHDGHITVQSQLGVGTRFHIYLPAAEKPVEVEEGPVGEMHVGEGRILVTDDEEVVRHVAGEMLRGMGYKVDFAADGMEAVQIYKQARQDGTPFDAVIMDLTIPGAMGGRDAMQKLLEIDADVKGIVSSGYSNDPVMSNYRSHGFAGMVAKPFQLSELSRALRSVMKAGE